MSNVITNRMDRPWTFVAPGWAFSFTLKPLEMRVLSDEEAKAVSANPSVARLVDSGLLAMDTPKKDAEAVNTVAQTQKRVKDAEKSEVLTAPSGNKMCIRDRWSTCRASPGPTTIRIRFQRAMTGRNATSFKGWKPTFPGWSCSTARRSSTGRP